MEKQETTQGISLGVGIVIAGVLIAGAILMTGGAPSEKKADTGASGSIFGSITEEDHVYGDPDAPITIIEYSDFECPFCARYHPTVKQVVSENPDVKWVYRHFPLGNHPNARPAALASECVAEVGGDDLFWEFGDYLFANQTTLGEELYLSFVREKGIDEALYNECVVSEKYAQKINDNQLDGQLAGATGTPFSLLVSPSGETVPFSGALPKETVQSLVDKVRG